MVPSADELAKVFLLGGGGFGVVEIDMFTLLLGLEGFDLPRCGRGGTIPSHDGGSYAIPRHPSSHGHGRHTFLPKKRNN